jgi:hypothetical protein
MAKMLESQGEDSSGDTIDGDNSSDSSSTTKTKKRGTYRKPRRQQILQQIRQMLVSNYTIDEIKAAFPVCLNGLYIAIWIYPT